MIRKFDFLVIGSGVAGMSYALQAAASGKGRVALVCKTSIEEANTAKAQGGVAEPSEERMLEANRFADEKIASANTRKEYVPAAHDDWRDSYLLEQYYKDLLTN